MISNFIFCQHRHYSNMPWCPVFSTRLLRRQRNIRSMRLNMIWQRGKGVRHSHMENSQQQMSRWLPTRWWRREEAHSWRPGDQRRAAWGRQNRRQKCHEVRHNPKPNRPSQSGSLLTRDGSRFTSLLWECQHRLRGPAKCHKPLQWYRPPPSDCSRCTCPGWTYWTIKQSNTLIGFEVTLCLRPKEPEETLFLGGTQARYNQSWNLHLLCLISSIIFTARGLG